MADIGIDRDQVHQIHPVVQVRPQALSERRERRQQQENPPRERGQVKEHFDEINRAVQVVDEVFTKQRLPHRVAVYREGERVLMDIIKLDEAGHITKVVKKDITHRDYQHWIQRLEEEEGIYFDGLV